MKRLLQPKSAILLLILLLSFSGCGARQEQLAFLETPSLAKGANEIAGGIASGENCISEAALVSAGAAGKDLSSRKSAVSSRSASSEAAVHKATSSDTDSSKAEEEKRKQKLAEKEKECRQLEDDYAIVKASYQHQLDACNNRIKELSDRLKELRDALEEREKDLERLLTVPGAGGMLEAQEQLEEQIAKDKKDIAALESELPVLTRQKEELEQSMSDAKYNYTVMHTLLKREIAELSGK